MLSILIEKTERHAAQASALRERFHKSSIVNIQFRLVRVGLFLTNRSNSNMVFSEYIVIDII
jgi:hypothetical protein